MNIRQFKNSRFWHKWIGLVCAAFFLILSVTGVLLMHYEEFGLQDSEVDGWFVPSKYFKVASSRRLLRSRRGDLARDFGFIIPVKMYVDLREGNNDTGLFKAIIDLHVQITE